jgi:hypothetical protein
LAVAALFFAAWHVQRSTGFAAEFQQDFSSVNLVEDLRGSGDGQFDFVDRAEDAAILSVADEAFQVEVLYDQNDPGKQNSGVRLSRLTPVEDGADFMVIRCQFEMKPRLWPELRHSIFNVVVGERFRGSAYFPAREKREDEGPAFASVSLVGTRSEGELMFSAGPRENSPSLPAVPNSKGTCVFPLVFVFNSGSKPVAFDSPSGPVEIEAGTFSVWVGDALVWHNAPAATRNAKLENFSFGLGRGTDATAEEGATSEGIYRLTNIQITTRK